MWFKCIVHKRLLKDYLIIYSQNNIYFKFEPRCFPDIIKAYANIFVTNIKQ